MPGTNLTRDEAQTRARLLDVDSYTVELDLTTGETTFVDHHHPRVPLHRAGRRDVRRPGRRRRSTRSPSTARPSTRPRSYADHRIALDGPPGDQRAGRARRVPLLAHRRGPAPLRRPGRRPRLHLHPVRGARRPPRLHDLRAARPQERLHLPRDRARRTGSSSPTHRPPSPRPLGEGGASGSSRRPSRCRPTSPRSSPASTTRSSHTYEGSYGDDPARPLLPPVAGRAHGHRRAGQAHLRRASPSSRRPSATPTRSTSTTSSTCRSTTWARWRTPAP